jgi:protein-S-isoprenylcysteine O-methyltransferase Ste14
MARRQGIEEKSGSITLMTLTLFCILSIPLAALSWRSLFSLKHHGFFRFIGWECILWISVSNHRYLIVREFDFQQIISSILMMTSLVLVLSAVYFMKKKGNAANRREDTTLFAFEKTTELVECGVFGYIRHPMYGSLLCLTWGILLRHIETTLIIVSLISTGACVLAAFIEEKENIDYFGDQYSRYQLKTKMFIPFIL